MDNRSRATGRPALVGLVACLGMVAGSMLVAAPAEAATNLVHRQASQSGAPTALAARRCTIRNNFRYCSRRQLAKRILNRTDIRYISWTDDSGNWGNPKRAAIRPTANGRRARTTCAWADVERTDMNKRLLRFILHLAKKHDRRIKITSLTDKCHSAGSRHYFGQAVDFACGLNVTKANRIGNKYGVSRNFENCSQHAHWHYSS